MHLFETLSEFLDCTYIDMHLLILLNPTRGTWVKIPLYCMGKTSLYFFNCFFV